jgi:hypothetical protein
VPRRPGRRSNHFGISDSWGDEPETPAAKLNLLETGFPAIFELSHPETILGRVRDVHENPHQVISVKNAAVTPVAFPIRRFMTGGPEVVHNLKDGLGKPFSRNGPPVIELEQ